MVVDSLDGRCSRTIQRYTSAAVPVAVWLHGGVSPVSCSGDTDVHRPGVCTDMPAAEQCAQYVDSDSLCVCSLVSTATYVVWDVVNISVSDGSYSRGTSA